MTVRVREAGDVPVMGKGTAGDLLVRVNVASSKDFVRQGVNLYYEARIPFHTAILGGRVRVQTLEGEVEVRIPTGTQSGEEMVLKGRGVPSVYGRNNGDLFVKFMMLLPRFGLRLRSPCNHERWLYCQIPDQTSTRTTSGLCWRRWGSLISILGTIFVDF